MSEHLRVCYEKIRSNAENNNFESYNVIETIEKYRNLWKPSKVRVILLAESHVYTSDEDFLKTFTYPLNNSSNNETFHFTRYVYCLGYGEKTLFSANRPQINSGTPQYWKLLHCALNDITQDEQPNISNAFKKYLITGNTNTDARLRHKVNLLERLKEHGIWLVDSSIIGINRSATTRFSPNQRRDILRTSWDYYTKKIITDTGCRAIVCIGKFVNSTLVNELRDISQDFITIPQPNSILFSSDAISCYKKISSYCGNNANTQ